jgi:hypothetical protein
MVQLSPCFMRSDLSNTSPTEVLGEILTQDIFKNHKMKLINLAKKVKNDSISLKAKAFKGIKKEESEDEESNSKSDEDMALFVKRFNKIMKKGQSRRGQSSKSAFNDRKCFECGEPRHISMNCSSKKKRTKAWMTRRINYLGIRRRMAKLILLRGLRC